LRTHTLEPPYVDEGFYPLYWDYGGDAVIDTLKKIRLTPDYPGRQGWVWSTHFLPADTWKVEFEFRISGKGSYLYGDGIAFWATTDRIIEGPVFGSKDYFKGLGVFFDTYSNAQHPYTFPRVSAMVGDGRTPYDHSNDGEAHSIGGCSAYFRGTEKPVKASITYLKNKFLQVRMMVDKDTWEDCFTATNVTLPNNLYMGFSAHTGDISDNHDLISVKTQSM
ncbi:legume-like lectin, partial [Dimargaris cristalligena]